MRYIFMDVDGCLISRTGLCNIEEDKLTDIIKEYEKKGFVFGINSNRGKNDIKKIMNRFDFSGPMIVENGSSIVYDKEVQLSEKIKIPKEYAPINIEKLKKGIYSGIFFDEERIYSMSVYCLKKNKADMENATKVENELRDQYPNHKIWTKPNGHVWCIPKGADKGSGLKNWQGLYQGTVAMIGHDKDDEPAFKVADISCATQNAKNIFADYKSPYNLTEGVIDCIMHLGENLK